LFALHKWLAQFGNELMDLGELNALRQEHLITGVGAERRHLHSLVLGALARSVPRPLIPLVEPGWCVLISTLPGEPVRGWQRWDKGNDPDKRFPRAWDSTLRNADPLSYYASDVHRSLKHYSARWRARGIRTRLAWVNLTGFGLSLLNVHGRPRSRPMITRFTPND
jgi:hypothetical protein